MLLEQMLLVVGLNAANHTALAITYPLPSFWSKETWGLRGILECGTPSAETRTILGKLVGH